MIACVSSVAAFAVGVGVGVGFLLFALALGIAAGEPRAPRCGHDPDCDVRNG